MATERHALEAALKGAETSLATLPRFLVHLLSTRAHALDGLGRNEEAVRAYEDVLRTDPSHFDALTSLGRLRLAAGQRAEAKRVLGRAAQVQPDNATGHANLATLLADEDATAAEAHYTRALSIDPQNRSAHRGLAVLLLRKGDAEAARQHGRAGFDGGAEARPYRGAGHPVTLLLVMSAAGGNVPVEALLDDRVFRRWTLAPEFLEAGAELPPHDLVFNGVGDADLCGAALDVTAAALARTKAP